MNTSSHRPTTLWSKKSRTPSVKKYIGAFCGEIDTYGLESNYPYQGRASAVFRRLTKVDSSYFDRFEGKGTGCWALKKKDRILNSVTADLLAAADALSGKSEAESLSACPGGVADCGKVWVSLLDGGVGVDVVVQEHATTNRVCACQCTTIRGPRCYRALLELLGFDWINRKQFGEEVTPSHEEIAKLVNDLLLSGTS